MANIVPRNTQLGRRRSEDRDTVRALVRMEVDTTVEVAETRHIASRQAAKIDAVTYVGEIGMGRVAFLSDREQHLARLCPIATSRLEAIANLTALGIAEVVADTVRNLR